MKTLFVIFALATLATSIKAEALHGLPYICNGLPTPPGGSRTANGFDAAVSGDITIVLSSQIQIGVPGARPGCFVTVSVKTSDLSISHISVTIKRDTGTESADQAVGNQQFTDFVFWLDQNAQVSSIAVKERTPFAVFTN